MSHPLPVLRAWMMPESSATAAVSPVHWSTIEGAPMRAGGLFGSPVRCIRPDSACIR